MKVLVSYAGKTRAIAGKTTIRVLRNGVAITVKVRDLKVGDLAGYGPRESETGARRLVPITNVERK